MLLFTVLSSSAAARKPNIILILADDLGYADIGCFGNKTIKTPNLDALAKDGMIFTDFHSNGVVCSPTRAALLTGRYQQRSGITGVVTAKGHRDTGLALEEITFAEVLRDNGYRTALFGKWHVGYKPEFNPIHQGFEEFVGFVSGNVDFFLHIDQEGHEDWWKQDELSAEEGYTTDLLTKHTVDFIDKNRDNPFLIYLAQEAPHYPLQGRNSPPVYIPGKGKVGKPIPEGGNAKALYKEMIEVMDEGIGKIRETIEKAGLSEETLFIFTSDNGPAGSGTAKPLRGRKGTIYEGGHRVPTIFCWSGHIPVGSVSDVPAMTADLFPTMAAVAGVTLPESLKLDGVSLLPVLTEGELLQPRPLYWSTRRSKAIRSGDYKLITNSDFNNPQLYNLSDDLGEQNDIASDNPEKVEALIHQLKLWHEEVTEGVTNRS